MSWTPEDRAKYKTLKPHQQLQIANQPANKGKRELKQLIEQDKLHLVPYPQTVDEIFGDIGRTKQASKEAVVAMLRMVSEKTPVFTPMIELWDKAPYEERRKLKLEDLRKQVGISIDEFLVELLPTANRIGINIAKARLSFAQGFLVGKSIEAAADIETGFRDRQMLLQAGGVAPVRPGAQINIQQNNANAANAETPRGLRSFEDHVIEITEAIRE